MDQIQAAAKGIGADLRESLGQLQRYQAAASIESVAPHLGHAASERYLFEIAAVGESLHADPAHGVGQLDVQEGIIAGKGPSAHSRNRQALDFPRHHDRGRRTDIIGEGDLSRLDRIMEISGRILRLYPGGKNKDRQQDQALNPCARWQMQGTFGGGTGRAALSGGGVNFSLHNSLNSLIMGRINPFVTSILA